MKTVVKYFYARFFSFFYFVREWEGKAIVPSKPYHLVFFSHYDEQGRVHDYVVHYLKELSNNGGLIVFVSTSPYIDEESIRKIEAYCFRIILRKNIGLDFGSWRMAFDRYKGLLPHSKSLLLVNDSCFGPLYSLKPILADFEGRGGVSGITLNYEVSPHLQSYFLYIPSSLFGSTFFKNFMWKVQYEKDKNKVIYNYEIGFSTNALENGISLHAWVDNNLLEKSSPGVDGKKNLTIWYCDLLVEKKLSPFVKKAIFTNSAHLITPQQQATRKLLFKEYPEYQKMIEEYFEKRA